METARSGNAPLFYEALGLLKEHDAFRLVFDTKDFSSYVPPDFDAGLARKVQGNVEGMQSAHLGMLRVQAANAALSIVMYIDFQGRRVAGLCDKRVQDVKGGPVVAGVSLLESIRATGDWTRHHYDWTPKDVNHWPVRTLTAMGLDFGDALLPA